MVIGRPINWTQNRCITGINDSIDKSSRLLIHYRIVESINESIHSSCVERINTATWISIIKLLWR